jgi:hypothetical protein
VSNFRKYKRLNNNDHGHKGSHKGEMDPIDAEKIWIMAIRVIFMVTIITILVEKYVEILLALKESELKSKVGVSLFQKSTAVENKEGKLKQSGALFTDQDYILIIIKLKVGYETF